MKLVHWQLQVQAADTIYREETLEKVRYSRPIAIDVSLITMLLVITYGSESFIRPGSLSPRGSAPAGP